MNDKRLTKLVLNIKVIVFFMLSIRRASERMPGTPASGLSVSEMFIVYYVVSSLIGKSTYNIIMLQSKISDDTLS